MRFLAHVQLHVVGRGLDPVNLIHAQKENAPARLAHQSFERLRPGFEIGQQRGQFLVSRPSSLTGDLMFGSLQSLVEPLAVERLEQVIERVDFKGAQRILIVGRDEDDHRSLLDRLQYAEAVEFRNLHIQEEEVWLVSLDSRHSSQPVAAFANDLDFGVADEQVGDPLARQRLIINNQRTDLTHKLYSVADFSSPRKGMLRLTTNPPLS